MDDEVLPENLQRLARWLGLNAAVPPHVLAKLISLRILETTTTPNSSN